MTRKAGSGFTLIELVVVIAIVAILAAIAIPNFQNHSLRARRTDAREMLRRIAAAQERFYTNRNRYTEDLTSAEGINLGSPDSQAGYYRMSIEVAEDGQSYTLTATPQGIQRDDKCAHLTVNNVGARGYGGNQTNGNCW